MRVLQTIGLVAILCLTGIARAHDVPEVDGRALSCATCHESSEPSEGDASLRSCFRHGDTADPQHTSAEAPDVFIMDELSDIYVPVVFPHKLHAAMTEMTGGCSICHHNQEDGLIHKCKSCHGGPSNPDNLSQPGLKGAYHRQCLSCHREWTHKTDCVVCHAKIDPSKPFAPATSPADIMGMRHPRIEAPDTRVFNSEELEDAPYVTFHHKEHVEVFDLKCVQCHQRESCARCHDLGDQAQPVRSDPHEDCVRCHQTEVENDCTYCHADRQKDGFNHVLRAGFDLAPYHVDLGCRQCHQGADRFNDLEHGCGNCHEPDWQPEDFDHAKTGTHLDEMHQELWCADCHVKGFEEPAVCADCHDDGRTSFAQISPEAPDAPAEAKDTPAPPATETATETSGG